MKVTLRCVLNNRDTAVVFQKERDIPVVAVPINIKESFGAVTYEDLMLDQENNVILVAKILTGSIRGYERAVKDLESAEFKTVPNNDYFVKNNDNDVDAILRRILS